MAILKVPKEQISIVFFVDFDVAIHAGQPINTFKADSGETSYPACMFKSSPAG
jgi:hypothetical protein